MPSSDHRYPLVHLVFVGLLLVAFGRLAHVRAYALPLSEALLSQKPFSEYVSSSGPNYFGVMPDQRGYYLCNNATRQLDGWRPVSEYPDEPFIESSGQRFFLDPKGGTYDIYLFEQGASGWEMTAVRKGYAYGCLAFEGLAVGAVQPPPAEKTYRLTIKYVHADGSTAYPAQVYELAAGRAYEYESPSVKGHSPDTAVVSGTMPAADRTVTVTYSPKQYRVTIHYVYADGTTAYETQVYDVTYGQRYAYPSPLIAGYTPDKSAITGTMDAGNPIYTVVYSTTAYDLTIQYVYPDGSTASPTMVYPVQQGRAYKVPSPVVVGYKPDIDPVTGIMGGAEKVVTVTYHPVSHTVTIHYRYEDGTDAAPSESHLVEYGQTYSYKPPAVEGYVPNYTEVRGLMLDKDQTVIVTYKPRKYSLTINYVLPDGSPAAPYRVYQLPAGKAYAYPSPGVAGYTPDVLIVTGTMPRGDKTVTVVYHPERRSLTVRYIYEDGTKAAPSFSVTYLVGESYLIPSPTIAGWVADKPVVSGNMPAYNTSITVTYHPEGWVDPGGGGDDSSSSDSSGSGSGPSGGGGDDGGGGSTSGSGGGGGGGGGDGGDSSSGTSGWGGDGGGIHRPGDYPSDSPPPGGYLPDGIEDDFGLQGPKLPDLDDFDWQFWDPDKHQEGALQFEDTLPLPEGTFPGVPDVVPGDPGVTEDPLDPDKYGYGEGDKHDLYYYLEQYFGIHADRGPSE